MLAANLDQAPTSWTHDEAIDINGTSITKQSNGDLPTSFLDGRCIRTVYGLIPLKQALDWPVFASYDELSGCAAWMGGRIPTIEEARSIYVYVERQKKDLLKSKLANKVPAVNGYFPLFIPYLISSLNFRFNILQPPLKQRRRRDPSTSHFPQGR